MNADTIPIDHGQLEYRVDEPDGEPRARAVFCHPHPEHGGSMHNKVVYHSAKALVDLGVTVLRFNFRGVGQSTGEFDDGVGEREDARRAIEFLRDRTPEVPFILGGFSFGSMVALSLVAETDGVGSAIGVGLPVSLYDFQYLNDIEVPTLVVQGERDEFGVPRELRSVIAEEGTRITIEIIDGTDHFLTDRYDELSRAVKNYFSTGEGASVLNDESTRHGRGIP
jgi:alpha/beta superfamily hydrolase